jgi:PIN domain nuclease of toxin-antitoxin system
MADVLLLDTCALLWWTAGAKMDRKALAAIDRAARRGLIRISPFSAWEVALLESRGRSPVAMPVMRWYAAALTLDGVAETDLLASTLAAAWSLPGQPPNDPADRIMISTAREHGFVVVTRDGPILDYGGQGYVGVLEC